MPYIQGERRYELTPYTAEAQTAGELNFQITQLFLSYMETHGLSYGTINDIMGAAEGAKQEFYRRVAAPYENHKIDMNGDVYP